MDNKQDRGYVLFINLILITLIGLFIPLLIQQQKINYQILNNRITAAQNMEAVESGLQYQLYFLNKENLLLDKTIKFNDKIELILKGREDDNFIYLSVSLDDDIAYDAEMKLEKESRKIIEKIIYRSE
jgi:general stress protein 26